MRTFLFAFAFMLTLAAPADAASRNFGVTSFTKVRVDGPFKVTLATGVAAVCKGKRLGRRARPAGHRSARRYARRSVECVFVGRLSGRECRSGRGQRRHARP